MALDKEDLIFSGIVIAILATFFYYILGLSGAVSALAIILLFIVPAYFILDNFELGKDEKIVFSFFISAGIFPIFSYWLGTVMSFKLAIIITFAVLIAAGILVRRSRKSKKSKEN